MATQLFRQDAIEAGRQRLVGTVIAAVPPSSRIYTRLIVAIVVAMVLLLIFGSYARREQVPGLIVYSQGVAELTAQSPAVVDRVHVQEGQRVAKGDAMVTIGLSQGRDSGGDGVMGQLRQLDLQYQELARQRQLSGILATTEAGTLGRQRTSLSQSLESLARQKQLVTSQAKLAEAQADRATRLLKQGAGSKQDQEEKLAILGARRLEVEAVGERIINQQDAMKLIDGQIAARSIGADQSTSMIAERMAAISEQRASVMRQDHLELTAPIDGIVGDIAARAGQRVGSADILMAIVPQQSKLEVELFAPSSAVGFVREGQQVRLMLDAFPVQKYGALDGKVRWVSSVPTQPSGVKDGKPQTEPMFRVRVSIAPDQFRRHVPTGTLRAGMTLNGNLILENRSLWEVFFEPILKAFRK